MFWEYDGKFIREIPINWLSFPLADFPTLNILHNFCLLVPNSTKLLKVSENVKLPYINATPLEHRSKQILLLKCVKPFELFWCTHVRSLSALINGSKAILESYSSNFLKLVKKKKDHYSKTLFKIHSQQFKNILYHNYSFFLAASNTSQ